MVLDASLDKDTMLFHGRFQKRQLDAFVEAICTCEDDYCKVTQVVRVAIEYEVKTSKGGRKDMTHMRPHGDYMWKLYMLCANFEDLEVVSLIPVEDLTIDNVGCLEGELKLFETGPSVTYQAFENWRRGRKLKFLRSEQSFPEVKFARLGVGN